MIRRSSYVCSIDTQPYETAETVSPSSDNYLKPPSPIYGSSRNSRNGSVATDNVTETENYSENDYFEEEKSRKGHSIVSINEHMRDPIMVPYTIYTTLLGLNYGFFRSKKINQLNAAYCYAVFVILLAGSVRRFLQVGTREPGLPAVSWGQAIFDPTIVITLCNAIFLMSGSMSALALIMMRRKKEDFAASFGSSLRKYRDSLDEKKEARNVRILVFFCICLSLLSTASTLCYKIKALQLPWIPPLITEHWYFWPLEFYLMFMAENAITILTIAFANSCAIIRYSIQSLLKNMVPGDHEDCPLPEESLRRIRDVQVHHQEILSAKTMLEENFSFVLFFSYGCAIPAICFLGYLILKNISSQDNWALHMSLVMWILTTLAALLMMSVPAFMIHEDGEKLLAASFKMYHEALCEERDLLVVSQMTLLVFQIHSAKLTLSASNYFSMNRKILISLFSAIFTYFLILVQFGESTAKSLEDFGDNVTSLFE